MTSQASMKKDGLPGVILSGVKYQGFMEGIQRCAVCKAFIKLPSLNYKIQKNITLFKLVRNICNQSA
jgi:hypothetical protein